MPISFLKEDSHFQCTSQSWALHSIAEIFAHSCNKMYSVQFSRSVVSDSFRPHELQHARPPCPSPTPRVHPNSCPSSQWCHPAISSSCRPLLLLPPIPPSIRVLKVHLVKAMVFLVLMYGCESWTVKKAERRTIDAFELLFTHVVVVGHVWLFATP